MSVDISDIDAVLKALPPEWGNLFVILAKQEARIKRLEKAVFK